MTSDNREHFEEARTARDVLRGKSLCEAGPLAHPAIHPGPPAEPWVATALEPALCARFHECKLILDICYCGLEIQGMVKDAFLPQYCIVLYYNSKIFLS